MPRLVCHFNRIQTNIKKPLQNTVKTREIYRGQEVGGIRAYLLVDGFQRSCDRQVILEFDRDALIGERFEN
jgi:hypothetical protein